MDEAFGPFFFLGLMVPSLFPGAAEPPFFFVSGPRPERAFGPPDARGALRDSPRAASGALPRFRSPRALAVAATC